MQVIATRFHMPSAIVDLEGGVNYEVQKMGQRGNQSV